MKNAREMFEDYYRPTFGFNEQWNAIGPRGTYRNDTLQYMYEGFHAAYQALQSELDKVKSESQGISGLEFYKLKSKEQYEQLIALQSELEKVKEELSDTIRMSDGQSKQYHLLRAELATEKAKSEKLVEALEVAKKGLSSGTRLEIIDDAIREYRGEK
jgi:hypothetical protein